MIDSLLINYFQSRGCDCPEAYRSLLSGEVKLMGRDAETVVLDAAYFIRLNESLRSSQNHGLFGKPWPDWAIAVGEEGNGDIYFLHAQKNGNPIYLANHEEDPGSLPELPAEFIADNFLSWMLVLRTRNAKEEVIYPLAFANSGADEIKMLMIDPSPENLERFFNARVNAATRIENFHAIDEQVYMDNSLTNLDKNTCQKLLGNAFDIVDAQESLIGYTLALSLLSDLAESAFPPPLPEPFQRFNEDRDITPPTPSALARWRLIAPRICRNGLQRLRAVHSLEWVFGDMDSFVIIRGADER